jgi:hypothetical protein
MNLRQRFALTNSSIWVVGAIIVARLENGTWDSIFCLGVGVAYLFVGLFGGDKHE